ncbi:hypothetical protein O0L34_g8637 [Tuta absoluta]|nr:hypothetical protein O0L34_g8637 [Tuta absoluta]
MMKHIVDDHPPPLYPELYLKPRRLDFYGHQLQENMKVNKELLKRINIIQRSGGFVDCWNTPQTCKRNKLMCKHRQRRLNEIRKQNFNIYQRLLIAHSEQPCTKDLAAMWKSTKHKLILGAQQPFILFKQGSLDKNMKDPAFDKPPDVYRPRVSIEVWVRGGSKIGRATIELFTDIVPDTCKFFLSLIKGDLNGFAYSGTRIFRIVPGLYCRCGDVSKDNGFGCYLRPGAIEPMSAENFNLKHTVPGVVSMAVTSDNEACGQFNIIFKPLPQLDGKHVVFGRITSGPAQFLERISALGLPLGTTVGDVVIQSCGWITRTNNYHEGAPNTIKFPPRSHAKV